MKNVQKIVYVSGVMLAAGALLVAGTPAFAATNLLADGNFQTPVQISSNSFGELEAGDTFGAWNVLSHVEPLVAPKYPVVDGTQALDMDGGSPAGQISQSFATTPGSQYLVSFEMTAMGGTETRQVRASVGGATVVTGTWDPASDAARVYIPVTGTFTATAATSTLTLTSVNTNNSVTPIDNASVTLVDPADSPLVNPAVGGIAGGIAVLAAVGVYLGRRFRTARR